MPSPNEDNKPFPIAIANASRSLSLSLIPILLSDRNVHGQSVWGVTQVKPSQVKPSNQPAQKRTDQANLFLLLSHSTSASLSGVCVCVCVCLLLFFCAWTCCSPMGFSRSRRRRSRISDLDSVLVWVWVLSLRPRSNRWSVGRSVVRSILITLIKVLPSLVFFTPFLTNYAGISCFRFCSRPKTKRETVASVGRAVLIVVPLAPHLYCSLSLCHSLGISYFLFLTLAVWTFDL